jgi:Fic-DOC domain mobile mystery protein B
MTRIVTTRNESLNSADRNTPLDDDEIEGLIPANIQSKAELNAWEAVNIGQATAWAYGRAHVNILRVETLKELHRRMFGATWNWAGTFRKSDKNISSYPWSQVPMLARNLIEDTRVQYDGSEKSDVAADDIAMRFHHRLVQIHPWPNGNGRHARLATTLLLREWLRPAFTWGQISDGGSSEDVRRRYITALQAADGGEFKALQEFVRS